MLLETNMEGVDIIDEIVRMEAYGSLYRGFLNNTAMLSLGTYSSGSYGIYSGANKTGTHYHVILNGTPTDAATVFVDVVTGIIYATTNTTLYVSYCAMEPIPRLPYYSIDLPYFIPTGEAITITRSFPQFVKFAYVEFSVNTLPSSAVTFTFSNGTENQTVTLATTGANQKFTFTDILKITTGESLTVSTTDGKGMSDVTITLFDV